MSLTITIGWWLIPTFFTIGAFGAYWAWEARQPPASGYGAIGAGLGSALLLLFAVVASALAWIVYLSVRLYAAG